MFRKVATEIETELEKLKQLQAATWQQFLAESPLVKRLESRRFDERLYALYLIETFHYTSHNARNQALVAVRLPTQDVAYMRYCFRHSLEETGHEQMAAHDLGTLPSVLQGAPIPPPLPETEVLIGYLYWMALHGNPVQRLGYSFWAESSYGFIDGILGHLREHLRLRPDQMTFLGEHHARIDDVHAEQVRQILALTAKTRDDWNAVARVLETSLRLTHRILDRVDAEYEALQHGRAQRTGLFGMAA